MRWVSSVLLALLGGCLNPGTTVCADGTYCPVGTTCGATPGTCSNVTPDGGGSGDGGDCSVDAYDCASPTWQRMTSGTTAALVDVWALDDTHVFALAADGAVLRYDGQAWASLTTVPAVVAGSMQRALWGRSEREIYALAGGNDLQIWSGEEWGVSTSASNSLADVSGTSDFTIAVGTERTVQTQDSGSDWSEEILGGGNLFSVAASDSRWVAVGRMGQMLLRGRNGNSENGQFASVPGVPDLNGVAIASDGANDVTLAVGKVAAMELGVFRLETVNGVYQWMREAAMPLDANGTQTLYGTWAQGPAAMAVGERGVIYRRDAGGWIQEEAPAGVTDLRAVAGTPRNFFAVGASGTILRRSR